MTTKKQVTEKKDQLPAGAAMFEEDSGQGFEQTGKEDYAIPFLQVLQKMSPQVDPEEAGFVEGARPGQLINTVSEELWDGKVGVQVIPVHYQRSVIEWVPRNKGGGLVAEHDLDTGLLLLDECMQDENGRDIHPGTGNEFLDTRTHYVLILGEDGNYEPAVISMTRTKNRGSKRWMSLMSGIKLRRKDGGLFTPPMYSHVYRCFAEARSNDHGTFYVFSFKKERMLGTEEGDTELYQAAKGFRETIVGGEVKANHAASGEGTGSGEKEVNEFAD